jgi:predicted MFS family arabinose efflux permease
VSTTLAGYVSDHLGSNTAFLVLAAIAAAGLACIWTLMPETRPKDDATPPAEPTRGAASA